MSARALLLLLVVLAMSGPARAWEDATGARDMPWLGSGGRARWFHDRSSCFMCPTGYTDSERWGRSRWTGEDPYQTLGQAMAFLRRLHVLETWPAAYGEGDVGTGSEIVSPRAAPYRFTIVAIEPTVVVMSFDLGALLKLGGPAEGQSLGTPRLAQWVGFGTHVPATGTLLWFSPAVEQPPATVTLLTPERGEIVVRKDVRLDLRRANDVWVVTRP